MIGFCEKNEEKKMEKRQISKNLRKIINLRFTDRQREVHSEPYAYIRHSVKTSHFKYLTSYREKTTQKQLNLYTLVIYNN